MPSQDSLDRKTPFCLLATCGRLRHAPSPLFALG
jgi:hypothetical protein